MANQHRGDERLGELAERAPAHDTIPAAQRQVMTNRLAFVLHSATSRQPGIKLQAALRAVREMEFAGQTLVMLFSQAFSRDIADQMENRQHIEAAWEEVLGRRVVIRCSMLGETPASSGAPAAGSRSGRQRASWSPPRPPWRTPPLTWPPPGSAALTLVMPPPARGTR